jgi:hypothetical protein
MLPDSVNIGNANHPSLEFNRETIRLPRLPLTPAIGKPSANIGSVGRK